MFQNRCQPNCTPRMVNCGPDPRMANARANAIAQAGVQGGKCQDIFDCQTEVIIEPAITTAPNIINHHRRIEHIIPVVTENIQRNHAHHQFVVRPEPRFRQTFDSDFTVGRPLPPQQFMPAQQFAQQQQLVPVEIDVIEKFGLANQAGGFNGFSTQAQVDPFMGVANQGFSQAPMQNFFR